MGGAMTQRWVDAELVNSLEILDPADLPETLSDVTSIKHITQLSDLSFAETEIIILAVKPQIMDSLCTTLKPLLPPEIPVLSVAAGISTTTLQKHLGQDTPLIRAMPNTPAAIGKGITALTATKSVEDTQKQRVETLTNALGKTLWLDDESQMDAITALSGSGPAYIFYLIEVLTQSGIKIGLSPEHAAQLARQTVIGASALAETEAQTSASTLRENVTSPNGTTQAALDILMDQRLQALFDEALTAAQQRSIDLSE